ncbi:MAG: hypothetical protein JRC89_13135 [Deltaproteobacteria bacterium]|nr:hypothetical protein [Deltaproteobacteria bacterium]
MFRLVATLETMEEKTVTKNFAESKAESRTILDNYYSVQFTLSRMDPAYLFKLRDISSNGLCILVKQDSSAFKQLKVGDVVNMEYNPTESSGPTKLLKTQITSKNCYDRFKGHSLVELKVLTDVDSHCGGISYDL